MAKFVSNNVYHDSIVIPPPLLVVIEDVGWWSGESLPEKNEPYRTGMGRMHVPDDYTAIIRLAKKLKTKIIAGFVLCEWDRVGILKDCPSTTWKGRNWAGSSAGQEYQSTVVALLNKNPDSIAIALHGVGHEYWKNGISERTEFHDAGCAMRDANEVRHHLSLFDNLLESSGLDAPFPRIFIPPALKHSFGNGSEGIQNILSEFGIGFVLTVFGKAKQHAPPMFPSVTHECGVVLIERGLSPVSWDHVEAEPVFSFTHPVLPLHWSNILHPDPVKNVRVTDAWADYLIKGAAENRFIFLPDEMASFSQIIVNRLARIIPDKNGTVIDLADVKKIFPDNLPYEFYVFLPNIAKVNEKDGKLEHAWHISEGLMKIIPSRHTDQIRIRWQEGCPSGLNRS